MAAAAGRSNYRRAWTPAEEPCGQDVHRATLLRRSWTIAARPWDRMSLWPHSQAGGRRGRRRLRAPDPGKPRLGPKSVYSMRGLARLWRGGSGCARGAQARTPNIIEANITPQARAPRQPSKRPPDIFIVRCADPACMSVNMKMPRQG